MLATSSKTSTVSGGGADKLNDQTLLLVVGVMRSGTSLLYSLLNQHSRIAIMYEPNVLALPPAFSRVDEQGWLQRAELWNQSLSRHFGNEWRTALGGVNDARGLYRAYAARRGAMVYGEKCPSYCTKLPRIAREFPDARFIILRRDLGEIYESVIDAAKTDRWFGRRGMFPRMIRQQDGLMDGCRTLEAAGVPVHYVDYSRLVDGTEETMRGVCEFLGLEFEPNMATLHGADFTAVYNVPHHSHLRSLEIRRRDKETGVGDSELRQRVERFRARSNRMSGTTGEGGAEPSPVERAWVDAAGVYYSVVDLAVRLIYEAAPTSLLQTYRNLRGGRSHRQIVAQQ